MTTNGGTVYTHLEARVAELERAQAITTRELARTWRPRLLELERQVEQLLSYLEARAKTDDDDDARARSREQ